MKTRTRPGVPTIAKVFSALALAATCACGPAAAEVRAHTYPAEFRYLSKSQVSDAMLGFTRDVEEIDRLLRTTPTPSDDDRRALAMRLERMERVATELDGFHRSNEPMIDARMDHFRRDLALARAAVEATPPSYFLAGSITGSCLHCHGAQGSP
ncbi:hypothetical protein L6R52_41565 [Myxococcota bacterium]|nr:hypothetical protein [Myxococcota bacterium]